MRAFYALTYTSTGKLEDVKKQVRIMQSEELIEIALSHA